MSSFRILHLSDLHLTPKRQWDSDDVLMRALDAISDLCNRGLRPHVIAFSGDLANAGTVEDYEQVGKWIHNTILDPQGLAFKPQDIICVPGNHDVERSTVKFGAKSMQSKLRTQDDIAEVLAYDHDRETLLCRHKNYMDFLSSLYKEKVDKPWWLKNYEHEGSKITVIGLCSSWMSYSNDDKGNLLIGKYQLSQLDYPRDNESIRVAMVHHPLDYLQDFDSDYFQEILKLDFDILLRGHLHSHSTTKHDSLENGYIEIAAGSLYAGSDYPNSFHLLEISTDTRQVKLHHYLWHKHHWISDKNEYPSAANGIPIFDLPSKQNESPVSIPSSFESEDSDESESPMEMFGLQTEPSLLDAPPAAREAIKYLSCVPRIQLTFGSHDLRVRQAVRSETDFQLKNRRFVWLQSAWGVGVKPFVGTLLKNINEDDSLECFHLQCSDTDSGEDILDCVTRQFGMHIQQFCRWVGVLSESVLLIDDVSITTTIQQGEQGVTLQRIVKILLDYCPKLYIVILSSSAPTDEYFPVVEIQSLDQLDIKEYLAHHPNHPTPIDDVETLDRISRATGGLPHNLESVLESLQVSGLDEVLSSFTDDLASTSNIIEDVPQSMISLIDEMSKADDDFSHRCYNLLLALATLDYGEKLQTIKRMNPEAPFWDKHAKYLMDHALLDAIPLTSVASIDKSGLGNAFEAPKLLRLPRGVRDYVRARMTSEEFRSTIHAAADVLFGKKWRQGTVRLIKRDVFVGRDIGPGNEHSICVQLIKNALTTNANRYFKQVINVALNYCVSLKNNARYRDGYIAAEEILNLLASIENEDNSVANEIAELRLACAGCARMIKKLDKSVELINQVIETEELRVDRNRDKKIYLSLALAYDTMGLKDEALAAANKVCNLCSSNSANYMQAKSIILEHEKNGEQLEASLKRIETRARNEGHFTVASNISLTRAELSKDVDTKLSHLSRVLSGDSTDYNKIRAYIRKVNELLDAGRGASASAIDRRWLERGYSYLYGQRLSVLFDQCHNALWRLMQLDGNILGLLRLFRHSSFLWRLRGESDQEIRCFAELSSIGDLTSILAEQKGLVRYEIQYIDTRRKVLILDIK